MSHFDTWRNDKIIMTTLTGLKITHDYCKSCMVTVKKKAPQKWTIQLDVILSQSFKPMAAFKINTMNQRSVLINIEYFNNMS